MFKKLLTGLMPFFQEHYSNHFSGLLDDETEKLRGLWVNVKVLSNKEGKGNFLFQECRALTDQAQEGFMRDNTDNNLHCRVW